ncbi:MAG: hypothetical protein DBX61_10475 [Clostridiales bacterium]|nr:MAG: hypothetical protein DBX61_10475 [Clostridiales bacterium]
MNKYFEKDDSTLVQMTLLGDESAFEELVTRHQRAVKGTAFNVTGSRFSAEDASQDAFLSAWMNLSALREREKFGVWVCSIAKNHARTLVTHYHSAIPSISLNEFENFDIPDPTDFSLLEYDDLHEKVEALSEKIRETVKLHYFSDLSVKEIAKKLSISEGTVKWRLSEGRKQLRKGYGIMEKTYNENESVVSRVMRQVEALKLWIIKEDKSGFEAEYKAVLELVNELPDSKEKSHALADTWLLGAWWIPGQINDEVFAKIKKAAEDGHNEDVMQAVAGYESGKYTGRDRQNYMLNTQIPYFKEKGFLSALGYTWFWLGYEYRKIGQYEKAIEAFKETMKVMPPENEYYANAKAAIYCETKVLKSVQNKDDRTISITATGEILRFIDSKLYFWSEPGYDNGNDFTDCTSSLFWNLSMRNNLIFDPGMKVGDVMVSETGQGTLTFVSDKETCQTAAGTFKNCLVYEFKGNKYGLTYCKTFICAGIGIVRQEVERFGVKHKYELSEFKILGGDDVIPFAPGNRWDYCVISPDSTAFYESEHFFEVTAFENNTATVAAAFWLKILGYPDTFDGNIEKMKKNYYIKEDGKVKLVGVSETLRRAKELAVTKRQKKRVQAVDDVMRRILDTDPEFNPGYTEKGRWNFYNSYIINNSNGKVQIVKTEHFEWKDVPKDVDGIKMLFSSFDKIVDECGMGWWSDEWVPGFSAKPKSPLKEFTVLDDETVITPAGTFENCRHISFDLNFNDYFGGKSECWYAEGIGFVKFTHRINDDTVAVWLLTEYEGVGDGYFPIADGLYRKYEPADIGNGYRAALEYVFDSDENDTRIFRNATGNQNRAEYEKSIENQKSNS